MNLSKMTIGEIAALPVFAGHAYLVGEELTSLRGMVDAMTVGQLCQVFDPPVWDEASLLEGLEYTVARAFEEPVLFDLYPEDQKNALTQLTGIAAFPVQSEHDARFAIICPGGSYRHCCKIQEGFPVAKRLNELGIAAFVLQYRTGASFSFEGAEDDIAAALTFIARNREKFHVRPDGYAVMGFSAGGHVAGLWGTPSFGAAAHALPAPGIMILGYPAVTLEGIEEDEDVRPLLQYLPEDRDLSAYSVPYLAGRGYPPSFIWAFEHDMDLDPSVQGALLAKTLTQLGVPAVCELFEGNLHGVGLGVRTGAEGWLERAVDFWRKQVGDEG